MAFQNNDDNIIGRVNQTAGSFELLEPDRYGFELAAWKTEENRFFSETLKIDPKTGKEQRQNREQYVADYFVFNPSDPSEYLLGLTNGQRISFGEASLVLTEEGPGEWVHLDLGQFGDDHPSIRLRETDQQPFWPASDRGIDVRLSEIAWVIDAPFGS